MNINKLDEFTRGYIECALWAESAGLVWDDASNSFAESPESDASFQDHNFDIGDLDEASLAAIVSQCQAFQEQNAHALELATRQRPITGSSSAHGHDFWLTRNRHGAGFWDRGYRHGIGDILTKAAHLCGESRLYYDPEDGKVHLT